jgi:hypothetical protein
MRSRVTPRLVEQPRRLALLLAGQGEQQVLGGDVLVLEAAHLVERCHEQAAERLADPRLAAAVLLGTRLQERLQPGAQRLGGHLEPAEESGHQPVRLLQQGEEKVLGLDGGVLQGLRHLLRRLQRLL